VSDRWRTGATVYDAVDGDTLVQMPSGEWRVQADISVDEETIGRMKAGYLCIQCLEPHEVPFPEVCSLCGYRMRERQLKDLAQTHQLKDVHVGSHVKYGDEIERMNEIHAYEQRTGIVLPDSVRFPQGKL